MYIYGIHTCFVYLDRHIPQALYCIPQVLNRLNSYKKNHPNNFPIHVVSKSVLEKKTLSNDHQGIALQIPPPSPLSLKNTYTKGLLILDHLNDPRNIGSIFRTALLLDFEAVIVTKNHFPWQSGSLYKSASGALEYLPPTIVKNLSFTLSLLKKQGYWCVGLSHKSHQSIHTYTFDKKTALVIGSESKGLRPLTEENCDLTLSIPMAGARKYVDNLNVSQATAMAMYAYTNS